MNIKAYIPIFFICFIVNASVYAETVEIKDARKIKLKHSYRSHGRFFDLSKDHSKLILQYALEDSKNKEEYVQINNRGYGPYAEIRSIEANKDDSIIKYKRTKGSHKYCVNPIVNNCCLHIPFLKSITFAYAYSGGLSDKDNHEYYIEINDKKYGGFDYIDKVYSNKDKSFMSFRYFDDNQWYMWINKNVLGPYKQNAGLKNPIFNRTGNGYYFLYYENHDKKFVINGKTYGPFKSPKMYHNSDMKKWAITHYKNEKVQSVYSYGKSHTEKRHYVKTENETYGPFTGITAKPVFSSNGSIFGFTYFIRKYYRRNTRLLYNDKYYTRINNQTFGPYQNSGNLAISSDGKTTAFYFAKKIGKEVRYFTRINDTVKGPLPKNYFATSFGFIPGTSELYYRYALRSGTLFNIKGKRYGPYRIYNAKIKFSSTGKGFYFSMSRHGKYYVEIQNRKYGPFKEKVTPVGNSDFSKYGFPYKKGTWFYIQANKRSFGPFDKRTKLQFNEDFSTYGFIYRKNYKYYIRVNNRQRGPFIKTGFLKLAGKSDDFIFSYQRGNRWYLETRKKQYGPFKSLGAYSISPDGKTVIIAYSKGGFKDSCVQVNDRVYKNIIDIHSPVFNDDSTLYGFVFRKLIEDKWPHTRSRQYFANVNGTIIGPHEEVRCYPGGNRITLVCIDKRHAYLKEARSLLKGNSDK